MARIEFRSVSKTFGKVTAVDGIDLVIEDRSFTCLVGPSGSGKSTLLNLAAGFERPSTGSILIDGEDVSAVAPGGRDLAMVFQSYALYPHMSVYENIAFGLRVRGMHRQEIDQRVPRAAHMLQIQALMDRKPRQLSGGQRQRVALGRAITREPKAFLLDEPLSNLDAQLRFQMRAELKLLFERIGGTVIYVTHDQAEAMTLADQVVVMHEGRVQQAGAPVDVYRAPQNTFVAQFLGSPAMNLLRGVVSPDGAAFRLRNGGAGALEVPPHGEEVIVGVRPEDVEVGPARSFPHDAELEVVESLGSYDILYLVSAGQSLLAVTPTGVGAALGRGAISFGARTDALHVFDPQTGQRLSPGCETSATVARQAAVGPLG